MLPSRSLGLVLALASSLASPVFARTPRQESDPATALREGLPETWPPIVRRLENGRLDADDEIQQALIVALSRGSEEDFESLGPVLQHLGEELEEDLRVALLEGAPDGSSIDERRLLRAAFALPGGRQIVEAHLERSPVRLEALQGVCDGTSSGDALVLLLPLLERSQDRAMSLRGLRHLAQEDSIDEEELDAALISVRAPWDQAVRDLLEGIDPFDDRERIEQWLAHENGELRECALWAIGRAGSPMASLADAVAFEARDTGEDWRRATACWALGSLAAPGATCRASGLHEPPPDSPLFGGRFGGRRTGELPWDPERMQRTLIRQLESARLDAFSAPNYRPLGPDGKKLTLRELNFMFWRAPVDWITLEARWGAPEWSWPAADHGPGDPAALSEAARDSLLGALESQHTETRLAAFAAAREWNLDDPRLLRCAARDIASAATWPEQTRDMLALLHSRAAALAPHVGRLASTHVEGQLPPIGVSRLLARIDTDLALDGLVAGLLQGEGRWSAAQVRLLAAVDLERVSTDLQDRFLGAVERRFLRGEFLVTPFVAQRGVEAHGILREALRSDELPLQLVATAVLEAGGTTSRPFVEELEGLGIRKPTPRKFIEAALAAIR